MPTQTELERLWRREARRLARRRALAWWSSFALPGIVIASALTFVNTYVERTFFGEAVAPLPLFAILALCACLLALLITTRQMATPDQMLVEIDIALGMHNRLTSAAQGIGSWPPCPPNVHDGTTWMTQPLLMFGITTALLLWGSSLVPTRATAAAISANLEPPVALRELDALVEELKEEELVAEPDIEKLTTELNDLLSQPSEEWYSHHSLEAAESLREETARELDTLTERLLNAERSLLDFSKGNSDLSPSEQGALQQSLAEALDQLRKEGLQPSEELLESLRSLQGKTPSRQELRDKANELGEKGKAARKLLKKEGGDGEGQGSGEGEGESEGAEGTGSGKQSSENPPQNGGVSRGPGTAPLNLEEQPSQFTSQRNEGVTGEQINPESLGELTGLTGRTPTPEQDHSPQTSSGSNLRDGESHSLQLRAPPRERQILERFYQ